MEAATPNYLRQASQNLGKYLNFTRLHLGSASYPPSGALLAALAQCVARERGMLDAQKAALQNNIRRRLVAIREHHHL